jgi:hypothetical protein
MSIQGSLSTMSVADLLQFLAAGRKTGTLKIARGTIVKEIFLDDGVIVGSRSNDPKELIGQVLLHYGKIAEDQLQAAMEVHRQSGDKIGLVLAAKGFISSADVIYALRTRTLEIIYDLFIWEEAAFEFFDSEPLPHDLIRIRVEVTSVVMDGIYRIDEWARYREVIPSERTFFELAGGSASSVNDSKEIREALACVEKGMTATEICYNMHTSLFHGCALLFELIEKGVIKVAGEAEIPEPDDVSPLASPRTVTELLALADSEMKANGIENALSLIHGALEQEPNNAEARRLCARAEELYVRYAYQNGLSPTSVPRLLESLDQLEQERLDPQEGFVLSRINGEWDVASIVSVCPFREADSLRMIRKLIADGVVGIA